MDFDPGFLRTGLLLFLVLIASLAIHEWAHAFAADQLGDPTPGSEGRVTLNPLPHLDVIGSYVIPLVNIFLLSPLGSFFFPGWGKPVNVNPNYFRHRTRDHLLTVLAGPASNLVLALLAAVVGGLVVRVWPEAFELVQLIIVINVSLAVFNLLPVPPLDGGWLLKYAIGMSDETFMRISFYVSFGMILLINLPPFRVLIGTLVRMVATPYAVIFEAIA